MGQLPCEDSDRKTMVNVSFQRIFLPGSEVSTRKCGNSRKGKLDRKQRKHGRDTRYCRIAGGMIYCMDKKCRKRRYIIYEYL